MAEITIMNLRDPSPQGGGPKAIWTVGGGKGGTGKTLLASNLALSLAGMGQRVLLVDADLGGANVHTYFGLDSPKFGVGTFLNGEHLDVKGLTDEVGVHNLQLLTGTWQRGRLNNSAKDRGRLKRALRRARVDFVIVDVGSGSSPDVMDLFLMGDVCICLMVPEPTSVDNTYSFLKEAIYWRLLKSVRDQQLKAQLKEAFDHQRPGDFPAFQEIIDKAKIVSGHGRTGWPGESSSFLPLKLVINQVKAPEDAELGFSVRSVIHKCFGIRVAFVGYVEFDEMVSQSVRLRSPLLKSFPDSRAARGIENITNKLVAKEQLTISF